MKGFQDSLLQQDTWTRSTRSHSEDLSVTLPQLPAFLLDTTLRATCAVANCKGQVRFWKRSARPVFEGQWACSRVCSRKLVEASIRKQISSISTAAGESGVHQHRIPLGLVLLDRGVITHFQLRQALDAQRAAGHGRIGHWLQETCGISPEKITRARAAQWNRPMLPTTGFSPERMATVMPESLRLASGLLPLRVAANKILYAGFTDEVDLAAVNALERMTGLVVESGLVSEPDFAAAEARLGFASAVTCHEKTFADMPDLSDQMTDALFHHQPVASRLVSLHNVWWLRMWLEPAASGKQGTLPTTGEDVVDVLFRR